MKVKRKDRVLESLSPARITLAIIVALLILVVFFNYIVAQRKNVIVNAEQVTNKTAEYIASNIANEIGYAQSSIKLSAVTIAQAMDSDVLENPTEVILPMVENTPFGSIEYIRADGMNVMNIGQPFDASDRVYYIEGIKGNTGIWNNYHPKTSKETLMNFYTPLVYNGKITGVITGYIAATSQIAPLFETSLYGQDVIGLLVDENNMVVCSTVQSEYVQDLDLDMFMKRMGARGKDVQLIKDILSKTTETAASYQGDKYTGRVCTALIPGTQWKVVMIVPTKSFEGFISEYSKHSMIAIITITLILILYGAFILLMNLKRRREILAEKEILRTENLEIHDIIACANMGTWHIELVEGKDPRMHVDGTMAQLLGIDGQNKKPEEIYDEWFSRVTPEAVTSVLNSVAKMQQGFFDENTYLWEHPTKGKRYVRCGGTSLKIDNGYVLRGYHYDVDDVVREEQAKVEMLRETLNEKNEYYSTLNTLGDIFYSMHVIDLVENTVVEFNARESVREFVNHTNGAVDMMINVMAATTTDEYKEQALAFTDLTTLADRMKNKKIISTQFIGKNVGWFLASFITMEQDSEGRPTKVIYTTRVIDEEKKQEQQLIEKSQTDELTGLYNRRAYEEDIYAHNDTPSEDNFVYISLDVNGLKVVNDTLGHTAGDELLVGACACMKKSLGAYGRLYRTGGDEFVAIIFSDEQRLHEILVDFDDTMSGWSGKIVDSLTISYGCASKKENPSYSVRQLGTLAEERMYDAKEAHYRKSGLDRRGQKDAHKALCELYTKILKINITDDTYQIVNMDLSEQTAEKGFADSISKWLISFGKTGQVHPDDLQEYLKLTDLQYMKEYFLGDKTSLHIFYRRKYADGFKQVMMEIIPASDYSVDNQSMFLYVKNIDK